MIFQLFWQSRRAKKNKQVKLEGRIRYRKKVILVLGAVILGFVISWLPFTCAWMVSIIGYFDLSTKDQIRKARMYRFVFVPSLFSGIINVICSVQASTKFRKRLRNWKTRNAMEKSSLRWTSSGI